MITLAEFAQNMLASALGSFLGLVAFLVIFHPENLVRGKRG